MSQILLKLWLIGDRTSCRPIRSGIILVIKHSVINRMIVDYRPNWTPLSPVTITNTTVFYNGSLRADEINLWLAPSAKQRRNPCSGLPAVYPDMSTRHDWPVKKGLCFVLSWSPIKLKGNSKRTSGNSLSPLGVQNKDLCAASQTVLIRV